MPQDTNARHGIRSTLPLALIVAAAALIMVINARMTPLVTDELLGFYTAHQPSLAAILHFQATTPIVLEPPAFELIVHAFWKLFGAGSLALRIPSILFMLVYIAAQYLLLDKIAGRRTAILLSVVFFCIRLFDYGWQERPYSMVVAMVAVATVAWVTARQTDHRYRSLALCLLFFSLSLAINSHYFAIFAVLPFFFAEAVRTFERRRVDLPMVISLLAATASVSLTLPFRHAAMRFSNHVITGPIGWHEVLETYAFTLQPTFELTHLILDHVTRIATVIVLVVAAGCFWRFLKHKDWALEALIGGLLFSPVVTVGFAIFVLHAYRERYDLYQFLGLMLALGIFIGPWLDRWPRPVFLLVVVVMALAGVRRFQHSYVVQKELTADYYLLLEPPPQVAAMLQANSSLPVFAPVEACLDELMYGSALVRAHLRCIYSRDRELRWSGTDTVTLTSLVMQSQPGFVIVPYDEMLSTPGQRILIERDEDWECWIPDSLEQDGIAYTSLGPGMTGDVVQLAPNR